MPYHPAIGHLRSQTPRIGVIVGLVAAAMTLLALGPQRPELPSEQWYDLASQQVMGADMTYRLGMALQRFDAVLPISGEDTGHQLIEEAVAGYERLGLRRHPNPLAVYRLGVIYGHRGYRDKAGDFLTAAAGMDEANSNRYYALEEIYSEGKPPQDLSAQIQSLETDSDWLTDIAIEDGYRRLGEEQKANAVAARRDLRSQRFGLGCALLSGVAGLLVVTGGLTILVLFLRWGLTVRRPRARVPFLVPWTVIDVLEAVAALLLAMVVAGQGSALLWHNLLEGVVGPTGKAMLLMAQYIVVAVAILLLVLYRIRPRSPHPFSSLGLRVRHAWRLAGTGLVAYASFVAILALAAVLFRGMFALQAGDSIIQSVKTPGEAVIYFLLACVLAPVFEEIVFRGYVYAGLRRVAAPRPAMLLGGLIFASVHMNAGAIIIITLIGILLCYLYERTRSLLPGMVAHGLHNALVLAVVLLQST